MRRSLFKVIGLAVMLSALPFVIFSPARPLFPIDLTARCLVKVAPAAVGRFDQVYRVYSARFDSLADLRVFLPENEKVVGFLQTGDAPETSLWRPFGSRQVVQVTPEKSGEELSREHIHFIVVDGEALKYVYHITIDDLAKKWSAKEIGEKDLAVKASKGPQPWFVLQCP